MPRQVLLHIGTHKTGTTSLQHFLRNHEDLLARADAHYPPGFLVPGAHADLPLLTARPALTWPARLRLPETNQPGYRAAAEQHIRHQVRTSEHDVLVYSHEDLSYLRADDELGRLRDLLDGPEVRVVVFLRDRASFLRSYSEQLTAMRFDLSEDPSSFAYVEPDSWLVDYDGLLDGYRRAFGAANVHVFDYDAVMREDGSVIPAFAERLDIARSSLPPLEEYFLNRTGTQIRPTDEQLDAIRRRLSRLEP